MLLLPLLLSCAGPSGERDDLPKEGDGGGDPTGDGGSAADGGGGDTGDPPPVILGEATVTPGAGNPHLATVTVTIDHDATAWVEYGEVLPSGRTTPPVEVHAAEATELLVLGLKAGLDYTLVAHAEVDGAAWQSEALTVSVPPLADGFQRCIASTFADAHDPDEVFCTNGTTSSGRTFFCVDHQGDVVYQLASQPDELLYSTHPLSDGRWAAVSTTSDLLTLFDQKGEVVAEYRTSWFAGRTIWEHQWIDNHEVIELTEGEWEGALAFLTNSVEWVPGLGETVGQGIIVFDPDSREVLWDWSSTGDLGDGVPGDPLLNYARTGAGGFSWDFGHGNSLAHRVEDDGGQVFWLSLRAQDWIVAVDVEEEAIRWRFGRDGDFTLVQTIDDETSPEYPVSEWMYGQHDLRFRQHVGSRTQFTVFDNGFYRHGDDGGWAPNYSRVVEYRLDEDSMRAALVFDYGPTRESDPEYLYAWGMGGVMVLQDEARIAWSSGYGLGNGWSGPFLREVSYPDGELLWSLDCVDYGDGFYRVWWFPSLYERDWWVRP